MPIFTLLTIKNAFEKEQKQKKKTSSKESEAEQNESEDKGLIEKLEDAEDILDTVEKVSNLAQQKEL